MAKVLTMPALGQTVEEQRILQWFKNEGETVAKGEALAEFETDKTNVEWESPEAGVLRRILAPVDAYVPVNQPIAIVGTADEPIDALLPDSVKDAAPPAAQTADAASVAAPAASQKAVAASGAGRVLASPRARRQAEELGVEIGALAGRGTGPGGRIQSRDVLALQQEMSTAPAGAPAGEGAAGRGPKASPLARAVAENAGLDLAALAGSGSGGRIRADDVRQAAGDGRPAAPAFSAGGTRVVTLTGLRKRVADNIARSVRQSPHVTLNLSADMTEAQRLRAELLPSVEKATRAAGGDGVRLSPTDIIVKAVAGALKEFPHVNAHIEGDSLTLFDDIHIGLAVSLGEAGLIVPVVRDAGRRGLAEIARARQDLAARARAGKLGPDEITGGTFTITNLGAYGIESFNPIINPPQVAILGVGAIQDAVVARDGAPTVRPMMGLSLSFDHRAMDGAPAAAFLARVREILENPFLLLL